MSILANGPREITTRARSYRPQAHRVRRNHICAAYGTSFLICPHTRILIERPATQHAHAVENLLAFLKPGARVLDVGSGSGYLSAVLHHLVDGPGAAAESRVVAIEHIPELVDWSIENLKKDGLGKELETGRIKVVAGDGRKGESLTGFS